MAVFYHQIFIAQPIEKVFAAVADPTTHPQWQAGLIDTKGDGGGQTQLGSRGTERRRMFGRELEFPYEIIAYDSPHQWGFRALEGPIKLMAVLSFTSENGGTLIRSELTIPGILGAPLGRLMLAQQKQNYQRLKQLLETAML